MSKFPCTPQGELTVSPSIPCDLQPIPPEEVHSVPLPASLWLVLVGFATLLKLKTKRGQ